MIRIRSLLLFLSPWQSGSYDFGDGKADGRAEMKNPLCRGESLNLGLGRPPGEPRPMLALAMFCMMSIQFAFGSSVPRALKFIMIMSWLFCMLCVLCGLPMTHVKRMAMRCRFVGKRRCKESRRRVKLFWNDEREDTSEFFAHSTFPDDMYAWLESRRSAHDNELPHHDLLLGMPPPLIGNWNPYTAVRVGEASNPGPGNLWKRKRQWNKPKPNLVGGLSPEQLQAIVLQVVQSVVQTMCSDGLGHPKPKTKPKPKPRPKKASAVPVQNTDHVSSRHESWAPATRQTPVQHSSEPAPWTTVQWCLRGNDWNAPICSFSEFFARILEKPEDAAWACVVLIHDEEQRDEIAAVLLGRPNVKVTMVLLATRDMEFEVDGALCKCRSVPGLLGTRQSLRRPLL